MVVVPDARELGEEEPARCGRGERCPAAPAAGSSRRARTRRRVSHRVRTPARYPLTRLTSRPVAHCQVRSDRSTPEAFVCASVPASRALTSISRGQASRVAAELDLAWSLDPDGHGRAGWTRPGRRPGRRCSRAAWRRRRRAEPSVPPRACSSPSLPRPRGTGPRALAARDEFLRRGCRPLGQEPFRRPHRLLAVDDLDRDGTGGGVPGPGHRRLEDEREADSATAADRSATLATLTQRGTWMPSPAAIRRVRSLSLAVSSARAGARARKQPSWPASGGRARRPRWSRRPWE